MCRFVAISVVSNSWIRCYAAIPIQIQSGANNNSNILFWRYMLTEDYIMRLINQAVATLMIALGLKRNGQYRQALHTFDQALENMLGLNPHLINQLEDNLLLEMLTFLGKLDLDRLLVLADIYREQADVYSLLGQTENSGFAAQRSLRLYLELVLASDALPHLELLQKIEPLRIKLTSPSLPIETRLALMDYLDRLLASGDDFLGSAGLSRPYLLANVSTLDSPDLH
jgi:tetratricopeptide (TPR) repeat protein